MSTLTVRPTLDTVIELEEGRHYFVVTVAWEYDEARYVMVAPRPDAIKADFTATVLALPRDEGFVITDVKPL